MSSEDEFREAIISLLFFQDLLLLVIAIALLFG